jgi:hypothetical protein
MARRKRRSSSRELNHGKGNPKFVPPEARIAVFDQDGTTLGEQPMYTQIVYCLERVPAVEKKPDLKNVEPFKAVLFGQPGGNG